MVQPLNCKLLILSSQRSLPMVLALMTCQDMPAEAERRMETYFNHAFSGSSNMVWSGDITQNIDLVFSLMKNLHDSGGFAFVGAIAWSGGDSTCEAIMRSALNGWPTLVVQGSGRIADEIAAKLVTGDPQLLHQLPEDHKLALVEQHDPNTLRVALGRLEPTSVA